MTDTKRKLSARRLRDLSDAEFADRYSCDRFTAAILSNRFRYVVGHMSSQLLTHAFSPIIRDSADLSGTLTGPPWIGYPMAAVSETLPLFYGSIPDAVRIVIEEYGPDRLSPGDMIIVNDYYRVGTHLNDVCNIRPIFSDGRFVGAVSIRAHMLDMGGRAMGGFESTKLNIWEDGLRLPPMLVYSRDQPVRSTFKLLYDNTRFPDLIIPDLRTIFRSLQLGERLVLETIDRYGIEAYEGAICFADDASAETMSTALEQIPDGVYEGEEWLDGDGLPDSEPYRVCVKITKRGPRAELDLTGTSSASRSAVNCSWADVKTAIAIALKFLLDPANPVTSGTLRNIDVLVPPDTIVNPSPPHCCQFYWEPVLGIINAVFQALNPVCGPDGWAASDWGGTIQRAEGLYPDGRPWSSPSGGQGAGPWGATKHGDADSSQQMIFLNMMGGGIEPAELENPYVVLRSEYVADSAGPGIHRGGASNVHDLYWRYAGVHRVQQFHIRRAPAAGGVNGGGVGRLGAVWMWEQDDRDDRTPAYLPLSLHGSMYERARPISGVFDPVTNEANPEGKFVVIPDEVHAAAGALFRTLTSAGAGWGDPWTRDADRVLNDVRDEYVSIDGAARDYGVVVRGDPHRDPERLAVDRGATAELRGSRRSPSAPDG
jgi:N-methylhydantoinase B